MSDLSPQSGPKFNCAVLRRVYPVVRRTTLQQGEYSVARGRARLATRAGQAVFCCLQLKFGQLGGANTLSGPAMIRRGPVVVRARRRATACLDLKRQAPLLRSLQLVHATRQISYLFIQCHHPSTRNDAFQRHQESAEPTHDSETVDCATKSINEVKESRLVANAKVALRANA